MPASSVPSLVRANGEFRDRADLPDFKVDDVEREWRRQIEVATEILGQLPTHLDSHHGVHHLEQFAPLFSKLALEFGLPVRDRTAMFLLGAASTLTGSDVVLYDWTAKGLGAPALEEQLNAAFVGSAETSVIEVVTHPGYSDYALRKISSLSDLREIDREALVQFSRSEWLSRSGGTLVPFSYIGPSAGGP